MNKVLKATGLMLGITCMNVIVLSPGLLGVKIGGESDFQTAIGVTTLIASAAVLPYGIHRLFFKSAVVTSIPKREVKTSEEVVEDLRQYQNSTVLKKDVTIILEQVERMKKKKHALSDFLDKHFEPNEVSKEKFESVIAEVGSLFEHNIRTVHNKVSIFDESEYKSIMQKDATHFSKKILDVKTEHYQKFKESVKNAININEEILLDLDELLQEMTQLDSFDIQDSENMDCMKAMDGLIEQAKYYKH